MAFVVGYLAAPLALLLLLAPGCHAPRVDLATVPPRPDLPNRPALSLRAWGTGYAAIATEYSRHESSWSLASSRAFESDSGGGAVVALVVPGCNAVVDLAAQGDERFALCGVRDELWLHRQQANGSWRGELVPISANEKAQWPSLPRLAVGRAGIAVVSANSVAWSSSEARAWEVIAFTEPNELGHGAPPSAVLITSDALWLGYDHGEWSGSLQRARIAGGVLMAPEPVVERLNVLGMSAAEAEGVWIAGGLAHLVGRTAMLLHVRGAAIEAVVAQDNLSGTWLPARTPTPTQRLPEGSYFSAYATSPAGRPLVLDPERGIYQLEAGSLRLLLEGTFAGHLDAGHVLIQWGVQEFAALSQGGFVVALTSGEIVQIQAEGGLRKVVLPQDGDARRPAPAQAR